MRRAVLLPCFGLLLSGLLLALLATPIHGQTSSSSVQPRLAIYVGDAAPAWHGPETPTGGASNVPTAHIFDANRLKSRVSLLTLFSEIQTFGDSQDSSFQSWMAASPCGVPDIISLPGIVPNFLKTNSAGSLLHQWLQQGNIILSTGFPFSYIDCSLPGVSPGATVTINDCPTQLPGMMQSDPFGEEATARVLGRGFAQAFDTPTLDNMNTSLPNRTMTRTQLAVRYLPSLPDTFVSNAAGDSSFWGPGLVPPQSFSYPEIFGEDGGFYDPFLVRRFPVGTATSCPSTGNGLLFIYRQTQWAALGSSPEDARFGVASEFINNYYALAYLVSSTTSTITAPTAWPGYAPTITLLLRDGGSRVISLVSPITLSTTGTSPIVALSFSPVTSLLPPGTNPEEVDKPSGSYQYTLPVLPTSQEPKDVTVTMTVSPPGSLSSFQLTGSLRIGGVQQAVTAVSYSTDTEDLTIELSVVIDSPFFISEPSILSSGFPNNFTVAGGNTNLNIDIVNTNTTDCGSTSTSLCVLEYEFLLHRPPGGWGLQCTTLPTQTWTLKAESDILCRETSQTLAVSPCGTFTDAVAGVTDKVDIELSVEALSFCSSTYTASITVDSELLSSITLLPVSGDLIGGRQYILRLRVQSLAESAVPFLPIDSSLTSLTLNTVPAQDPYPLALVTAGEIVNLAVVNVNFMNDASSGDMFVDITFTVNPVAFSRTASYTFSAVLNIVQLSSSPSTRSSLSRQTSPSRDTELGFSHRFRIDPDTLPDPVTASPTAANVTATDPPSEPSDDSSDRAVIVTVLVCALVLAAAVVVMAVLLLRRRDRIRHSHPPGTFVVEQEDGSMVSVADTASFGGGWSVDGAASKRSSKPSAADELHRDSTSVESSTYRRRLNGGIEAEMRNAIPLVPHHHQMGGASISFDGSKDTVDSYDGDDDEQDQDSFEGASVITGV